MSVRSIVIVNDMLLASGESSLFWRSPSRKWAWSSTPSINVAVTGELMASCIIVPDSPMNMYFHLKYSCIVFVSVILITSIIDILVYAPGAPKYVLRILLLCNSTLRVEDSSTILARAIGREYISVGSPRLYLQAHAGDLNHFLELSVSISIFTVRRNAP